MGLPGGSQTAPNHCPAALKLTSCYSYQRGLEGSGYGSGGVFPKELTDQGSKRLRLLGLPEVPAERDQFEPPGTRYLLEELLSPRGGDEGVGGGPIDETTLHTRSLSDKPVAHALRS
jgi:hypothetical protein